MFIDIIFQFSSSKLVIFQLIWRSRIEFFVFIVSAGTRRSQYSLLWGRLAAPDQQIRLGTSTSQLETMFCFHCPPPIHPTPRLAVDFPLCPSPCQYFSHYLTFTAQLQLCKSGEREAGVPLSERRVSENFYPRHLSVGVGRAFSAVCLSVCLCVCIRSITQKRIIRKCSNLV